MKKLFRQIQQIDKIAYRPLPKAVCKLGEEYGELVQAYNVAMGMKKHKLSKQQIKSNIKEESADLIQNIFLLAGRMGITYGELCTTLGQKNKVWKRKYGNKNKNHISSILL